MVGKLVLQDGSVYDGTLIGAKKVAFGELVFTTSMTGYYETLTDPSYNGQIVLFSYPLIGNYTASDEYESDRIRAWGVVTSSIYEHSDIDYRLRKDGIPGITGIDTRSIVRKIRNHGTMKAIIGDIEKNIALNIINARPNPDKMDLVNHAGTDKVVRIDNNKRVTFAVIDVGVKRGILSNLSKYGNIVLLPYTTSYNELKNMDVNAMVISNGPGDPGHASLENVRDLIRRAMHNYPLLGICLGHQLIALASGAEIYKMKFGHRGVNHCVKYNGRIYVTSHNHGYAVSSNRLPDGFTITYVDINDGTIEGLKHKDLPIITTQYHPEAAPGPNDTSFIFDEFHKMVIDFDR
ncbi:MAG: glutamine-hydrolyzing carbamoyl-phosphate synthase small subunit [Candidatus Thermoplasmatota archaeon]|jgi:carbamoyl-phosphate synthase small subunit|nr:glutamine-hydrolyzing carbamoyl-phosphate synthase small subunit [Candidatus Thermoplasmatota archaeon]MCL5963604.1 glutamine-hydrolyzing carbamoyl-phosphate synthase small subunit [Candidatus Thermoplasmatota archaeon]